MKAVLYFVAGVAIGSAATFAIAKGYFEKEAEKRIQEESASIREAFLKRAAAKDLADKNSNMKGQKAQEIHDQDRSDESGVFMEDIENLEDAFDNGSKDSELSPDPEDEGEKKIIHDIRNIRQRYNRNVFDDYGDEEKFSAQDRIEEEFDDGVGLDGPSDGPAEDPYVINADQFANENRHYDKVTIFYYMDGHAIDTSHYEERIIDDLDQLIGMDNVDQLEELADEDGVVLIRNEMRSADYEILLQGENYIPGMTPVRD